MSRESMVTLRLPLVQSVRGSGTYYREAGRIKKGGFVSSINSLFYFFNFNFLIVSLKSLS